MMMREIGNELQRDREALSFPLAFDGSMGILDLCTAPGGYSLCALKINPRGTVRGISLPKEQSGHRMLIKNRHPGQIKVFFLDITMLATEFEVNDIPETHPDAASFLTDRPYIGRTDVPPCLL